MKYLIPILLFIVTWNEYVPTWHWIQEYRGYFTIDLSTQSIDLETQKDVDLYIGRPKRRFLYNGKIDGEPFEMWEEMGRNGGIISQNAFNIKVEEKK